MCIVLSPDNPEMHEELATEVFKSGKLVYIDKTFAPDKETAIRIFENGRFAHMYQCAELGFELTVADKENNAKVYPIESDFFKLFIDAMIKFFDTGDVPVLPEQTIDVIAIREAGAKALENPFVWVEV